MKNPTGKRADYRVLSRKYEHLFAEIKHHEVGGNTQLAILDLFKIAMFLLGAVNEMSDGKVKGLRRCFGIHVAGDTLDIYMMQKPADRLYTLSHLASLRVPRTLMDFMSLYELIDTLYAIKALIQDDMLTNGQVEEEAADVASDDENRKVQQIRIAVPTPRGMEKRVPKFKLGAEKGKAAPEAEGSG
ncbi:hypothetical protein HDV00_004202 [Rhizophlyctis rosea]|nr:hypothetical protein HDV00_004202 [Rhizophlyctis rosea]